MKWRLRFYGFLIGFGMLFASLAFYWKMDQETSKKVSGQLSRDANIVAVQLHTRLDHLNLTSEQALMNHSDFQRMKSLFSDYPEVEAIYLTEKDKITLLYPKEFDDRLISSLLSEHSVSDENSLPTKLRYADRLGQPYWALFTKVPSSKSQKIAVLIINIRTLVESFEIPWIHSIRILYNNSSIYESPPKPSNQVGAIETIISWGEEDFLMLTSASEIYLSSQTSSLGIVFLITALVLSAVGTALFYTIIQSRLLNKTLNESNHRFMAIYLHVGAPIIILNNESIHDVNPAALNVLGGNLDEFKGKSIFSFLLIDQNLTDEKIFNYRQKLRYESFVRFECKIKRRDGRVLDVELTITKGKSTSMTHSYVLINDLTEKKKQDEVFAREHDIMIDNTRLKSLATMAGGIAHEINNPLAIISGIAQQLHRKIQLKIPLTQVDQDACSKITRNTERISNIIGKLQSLTPQTQQLQFLDFSVDEFLNDMNLIYSKKCIEKNILWKIVNYCHGEQINCSPPQIEQVLEVLIENSIDSIQRFQDDRRYVHLMAQLKGNDIEFSVVDGGPKLSDDIVKNLMAPFFTTKEQGSGTGLNLSIAFALAKSHKGNLFYDKSADTVRFCFTIPKVVARQNRRAS